MITGDVFDTVPAKGQHGVGEEMRPCESRRSITSCAEEIFSVEIRVEWHVLC